ncbi:martik [Musca autumnalis]|uniref:martik n=1 Tax=Musca autumnalis TaxID=221902 RepID=UPI003CF825D6
MLIPRQKHSNGSGISVKKFPNSSIEIKPIYKKMPQHNPVNQLLSTAAAGNGVIGDVDALLTPMANTGKVNDSSGGGAGIINKERTERNLWRNDEVMEMLAVMQQTKALEKLNDKTVKSENVFKDVAAIMYKNGFVKKSHVQIWTKWKFLKSTYMTSRRNGIIPRMIPQEVYDTIHLMITNHNQGMSECGTSTTASMDGDNSNTGHVSRGSIDGATGPKIDSIDGNQPTERSFDMAHPIFGFSLGLVKDEPSDTGYNAIENNNVDPLSETQISNNTREKVPAPEITTKSIAENPPKKTLEIPHRGRGRPPKPKILPAATSTPTTAANATASPAATGPPNLQQMPPLRVAPFAKAANTINALTASRPPPPLTMPPSPRQIQITSIPNTSVTTKTTNNNSSKPLPKKILPKLSLPNELQATTTAMRFLKDLQTTNRASSPSNKHYPKLKQVPMRKTPYSLRPDRLIPDLDETFSPPRAELSAQADRFQQEAVVVNNSQPTQNGGFRKRRLDWSQQQRNTPTKFRKIPSDDEDILPPPPAIQQPSQHINLQKEESRRYGKHLHNVISDLSTNMRQIQNQMMREFFDKQHELLQKEHEFQMQQDRMIMETFQLQTYEIMKSVKELVGSITTITRRNEQLVEQHLSSNCNQEIIEHEELQNLGENHEEGEESIHNGEEMDSQDGMETSEMNHNENEFSQEDMVVQQQEEAEVDVNCQEQDETQDHQDNEVDSEHGYPGNPCDGDEQDGVQIQLQQHDEQMHQQSQSQDNETQNANGGIVGDDEDDDEDDDDDDDATDDDSDSDDVSSTTTDNEGIDGDSRHMMNGIPAANLEEMLSTELTEED